MTERERRNRAMIDQSLGKLRVVSKRASPLCPFLEDKDVYFRMPVPNTAKAEWVKEEALSRRRTPIASDAEVKEHVLSKDVMDYSLKFKLRDHVADLFGALASVNSEPNAKSVTKSCFTFDKRMEKELGVVETGNRKRTNLYSQWAEQRARARQLGLSSK